MSDAPDPCSPCVLDRDIDPRLTVYRSADRSKLATIQRAISMLALTR